MKPKDVKNNMIAAKFAYPDMEFTVSGMGGVFSGTFGPFELTNPRDYEKVLIKLKRDHGWDVKTVKRGGKDIYQAKHTNGVTIERPSLPALIVDLIGRVG